MDTKDGQDYGLKTTEEVGVGYRFRHGIIFTGDEQGVQISNYQLAGEHAAQRIKEIIGSEVVLEICTGIGVTTFTLAQEFPCVYTVDIDAMRLSIARANLTSLGVSSNVTFIHGDILDDDVLSALSTKGVKAAYTDVNFTPSNNWWEHESDIHNTQPSTVELYHKLRKITENICMKLPKIINLEQLRELSNCEIEEIKPDGQLSFYLVYWGDLVRQPSSEFAFPKYVSAQ